jgi:hypothetical protein
VEEHKAPEDKDAQKKKQGEFGLCLLKLILLL